jgi:SAM-dependent methyltransferase
VTDIPRYRHPVFALQYDLSEEETHLGDLTWYAERLENRAGPVLEIGAGTGRVTRHLAARGHRIIPTDIGYAMLRRIAPDRLSRWRAVTCDGRRLPFAGKSFGAALCAYNVWGCHDDPADLARSMDEAARVLKSGAPLWFDVAMQNHRDFPPGPKSFSWQTWTSPDGFHIRRRTTLHHRAEREWVALIYEYAWRAPDGTNHEETVEFGLNTWSLERYLGAARGAGFDIVGVEEKTFENPDGPMPMWAFVSLVNGR